MTGKWLGRSIDRLEDERFVRGQGRYVADLGLPAPVRSFSASPLQSLALLNDPCVLHYAQRMAERTATLRPEARDQVEHVVRLAWLREPTPEEADRLTALAEEHGLAAVCRLLVSSDEFLFLD